MFHFLRGNTRLSRVCLCAIMALMIVLLLQGPVCAQPQTFQSPVWGGSAAFSFNSTEAAKAGWYHTGIDFYGPNDQSTYILAANVGVVDSIVTLNPNDHGMGNCVVIRHAVVISSNGATTNYYTLYAHMDSIVNTLRVGQAVNRGQIIGVMGRSGYGDRYYAKYGRTPHLHFEVRTAGGTSNPYGPGPYWGYTPTPAQNYGYVNPAGVIGRWTAVPMSR